MAKFNGKNLKITYTDPAAIGVAGHALITVTDSLFAAQNNVPVRSHVFKAVCYADARTGMHCAMASLPALQMTGLDIGDAFGALADALENMMMDNYYDITRLARKYPPSLTGQETEEMFNFLAKARDPLALIRAR